MIIGVTRSGYRGFESGKDQVSTDVRNIVQAPESDLMARGVAFDLLQMAKRVGPQCEAAEYEDLSGAQSLVLDRIGPKGDNTEELSMKAPTSVSKPADLG